MNPVFLLFQLTLRHIKHVAMGTSRHLRSSLILTEVIEASFGMMSSRTCHVPTESQFILPSHFNSSNQFLKSVNIVGWK